MAENLPVLNGPCCGGRYILTPGGAQCEVCGNEYRFVEFPAFRARRVVTKPRELSGADDATCFFHAQNQAAAVCAGCGRFLCPVCAVDFGGRTLCPACIATGKTSPARAGNEAWLPDGVALLLATAPLLIWPFTLVTAPAAVVFIFINWGKPAGPVKKIRWQRWLALVFSLGQIAGWVCILGKMFLR